MKFRSWDLVEFPSLTETTRHTWSAKTSNKVDAQRHVVS